MTPEAMPSFWARRLPVVPVLLVAALVSAGSFAATSAVVGDDSDDAAPVVATTAVGQTAGDEKEGGEGSGGRGSADDRESGADRQRPADTGPSLATIDTLAGPLAVRSIAKTDEYPAGCSTEPDALGCTTSTEGSRIVVITLGTARGKTPQETMDALERGGGFASGEALEATIEEEGFDPLLASSVSTADDGIELAFAYLFSEDAKSVTLAWPGNPPVELNF